MSRIRIALGNKPSVAANMIPILKEKYDLLESLEQVSNPEAIDVVIPLCLADYDLLWANPLFGKKALFPAPHLIEICHDKLLFRQWFLQRFSADYLPGMTCLSTWVIAKPRRGEWGHNTYLIDSKDTAAIASVQADPGMYLEDYIAGTREYAMHILFDQGKVIYAAQATYDHHAESYVQGVADQPAPTSIVECSEVPLIFRQVLQALNYSGAACFDYKIDENGQIRIFELNPRFGGSLAYLTDTYVSRYVGCVKNRCYGK